MTSVVDGGTAVVPRDAVAPLRDKGLLAPREAVVQFQSHPRQRVRGGEVRPRGRRPRRLSALRARGGGHGQEAGVCKSTSEKLDNVYFRGKVLVADLINQNSDDR